MGCISKILYPLPETLPPSDSLESLYHSVRKDINRGLVDCDGCNATELDIVKYSLVNAFKFGTIVVETNYAEINYDCNSSYTLDTGHVYWVVWKVIMFWMYADLIDRTLGEYGDWRGQLEPHNNSVTFWKNTKFSGVSVAMSFIIQVENAINHSKRGTNVESEDRTEIKVDNEPSASIIKWVKRIGSWLDKEFSFLNNISEEVAGESPESVLALIEIEFAKKGCPTSFSEDHLPEKSNTARCSKTEKDIYVTDIKERFTFAKGQVLFDGVDMEVPTGDPIEMLKNLVKHWGRVVEYKSGNTADDRERGIKIKIKIEKRFKHYKVPCKIKAKRAEGYYICESSLLATQK